VEEALRSLVAEPDARNGVAGSLRAALRSPLAGLGLALVVLTAVFSLVEPAFVSSANVSAIVRAIAFIGVVAVGQTILMVTGYFDLSVGSVAALGAVVGSIAMTAWGVPVPVGIALGLAAGALAGFVNGVVTVGLRVPVFIATLGMLFIARGVVFVITQGRPVFPVPPDLQSLGDAAPLGLPLPVFAFLALALAGEIVLRLTRVGRALYATGANATVADLAGIRVVGYRLGAFVLCGTLAALAGLLLVAQIERADPTMGQGWELAVIAGVVIGGVSLQGGSGTILGTVLGLLLVQVIVSGLIVVGFDPTLQTVAIGVVLILAVGADRWRRARTTS
jgi:ribose transport system permease protein